MCRITKNIVYVLVVAIMIWHTGSMLAKGYMALKLDVGYEAEHQRPTNAMGTRVGESDTRNFIQNYGLTTNPNPTYNSIEGAQSYKEMSGDYYGADEFEEISGFTESESSHPFARDIEEQTRVSVDHPYEHQFD